MSACTAPVYDSRGGKGRTGLLLIGVQPDGLFKGVQLDGKPFVGVQPDGLSIPVV